MSGPSRRPGAAGGQAWRSVAVVAATGMFLGGATACGAAAGPGDDTGDLLGDDRSLVGEEVDVSAVVSDVVPTTDVGSAFRIAGRTGDPIAVVWAAPAPGVDVGDEVQVAGTVVEMYQGVFEEDFGMEADALFLDPERWFAQGEGELAIVADRVEMAGPEGD